MAKITFTCPSCARTLEVEESKADQEVECAACLEVFVPSRIKPAAKPEGMSEESRREDRDADRRRKDRDEDDRRGSERRTRRKPDRRRWRDEDDDSGDDDDYRPRRNRRLAEPGASSTAVFALILGFLAIVMSCCPILGFMLGITATILASQSRGDDSASGMAATASVLGVIGAIISAVWFFIAIVGGRLFNAGLGGN